MSDAIHAFHNGAARDQYVFYTGKPSVCGAHALAGGVLSEQEVSSSLASKLASTVDFYRTELDP